MAKIVIKKRVELGFLGEEHKQDYLLFKAIPVGEFKNIIEQRPETEDASQIDFIIDVLEGKFIEGKFLGEDVTKDNIKEFDAESIITCFTRLTGQDPDPKV